MTGVEAAMAAEVLACLVTLAAVVAVPRRAVRAAGVAGGLAVAGTGVWAGLAVLAGGAGSLSVPTALPWADPVLSPTPLGAVFTLVAACVGLVACLHAAGDARGAAASRTAWAALPVFLLGMQTVPAAGDVVAFLAAWELMAVASMVLVATEHARGPAVRSAAVWYAAMTQLSALLLVAGLAVAAAAAGDTRLAGIAAAGVEGAAGAAAFVLLTLGFACKAGVVPLHVWLPRAHPEAPAHVSAAMSAAMVATGVYGVLLVTLVLFPGGPAWWGVAILGLGAASALLGVLQASVATDLKRLLAHSTSENTGLMLVAAGAAVLCRATGEPAAADAAVVACLLLVVAHAAFKTTLFLAAGTVVHATGERDLDRLGGLGPRMPWTTAAFAAGALGAAALPVTGGLVAEWSLLQALVHGAGAGDRPTAVLLALVTGVVALTTGLALLTFTKALGIGFLARPRSEGAAGAREAGVAARAALAAGAVATVGMGLVPGPLATVLADAAGVGGAGTGGLLGVELPALGARLDTLALSLVIIAAAVPVLATAVVAGRRAPRRTTPLAWGCGGARTSPRMQYTATSYAEPLLRVFGAALLPRREVEVRRASGPLLVEGVRFRQRVGDVLEAWMFRPLIALVERVAARAAAIQNGSVHRYLGYAFAALVVVLLVVTL